MSAFKKDIVCTKCGGHLHGPLKAVDGGFTCKYIKCINCGEHYWETKKDTNYFAFNPKNLAPIIKKLSEFSW